MRISVNTCSKYAEEYGIKFNDKKSQCMFLEEKIVLRRQRSRL